MQNLEKLNNIQVVINELINNIKTTNDIQNKDENIKIIENKIKLYTEDSPSYFSTSYNIYNLKQILNLLMKIIIQQNKRILKLERKEE